MVVKSPTLVENNNSIDIPQLLTYIIDIVFSRTTENVYFLVHVRSFVPLLRKENLVNQVNHILPEYLNLYGFIQ